MSAAQSCHNCGQPLAAGATACLWCSVEIDLPAPIPVGAGAPGAAPAPIAALLQAGSQPTPPSAAASAPPPSFTTVPGSNRVLAGAGFRGHIATVGERLAALSIDVVSVVVLGGLAAAISRSVLLGAVIALQALVFLLVLEARTGATIGGAIVGIRTSQQATPYNPGIGRSAVRAIVIGAGFMVMAVGAWLVVASSAWDSRHRRYSWVDKASRTVMVGVDRSLAHRSLSAPRLSHVASGTAGAGAGHSSAASADDDSFSQSLTGTGTSTALMAEPPAPPPAVVEAVPGVESLTVPAPAPPDALLLVFDTGQRETVALPAAINLGRKPAATEAGDALIVINDPDSTASRTHVRIEHTLDLTYVTDLGSTNGTEIIDDAGKIRRLDPNERVVLDDGSRVRVGNRTLTISLMSTQAPTSEGGLA